MTMQQKITNHITKNRNTQVKLDERKVKRHPDKNVQ